MTELFGGFPASFYDAYRDAWPLTDGHVQRRTLYNLTTYSTISTCSAAAIYARRDA